MNSRIHAYLDDEAPSESLSAGEHEQAVALQRLLDRTAAHLHERSAPDMVGRVMAALPAADEDRKAASTPPSRLRLRRAAAWLWRPRPLQVNVRPALALALLLLLIGAAAAVWKAAERESGATANQSSGAAVYVQFRLEAPDAERVMLAGSFTDWKPRYELHETSPGVWSILVPLPPGVHDYTFVVDGSQWVPDPHAPQVPDHFGGANSRLTILPPAHDA
jgi:hypothetical protein